MTETNPLSWWHTRWFRRGAFSDATRGRLSLLEQRRAEWKKMVDVGGHYTLKDILQIAHEAMPGIVAVAADLDGKVFLYQSYLLSLMSTTWFQEPDVRPVRLEAIL